MPIDDCFNSGASVHHVQWRE